MTARVITDWAALLATMSPTRSIEVTIGAFESPQAVKLAAGWRVEAGAVVGTQWRWSAWEKFCAIQRAGGFDPEWAITLDHHRDTLSAYEREFDGMGPPPEWAIGLDSIAAIAQQPTPHT